jgi:hypothetical protein
MKRTLDKFSHSRYMFFNLVDMKIIKLFSFFRSTSELSRSGRKSLKSRQPSFAAVRSDTWDYPLRSRIPFYRRWVLFQYS